MLTDKIETGNSQADSIKKYFDRLAKGFLILAKNGDVTAIK